MVGADASTSKATAYKVAAESSTPTSLAPTAGWADGWFNAVDISSAQMIVLGGVTNPESVELPYAYMIDLAGSNFTPVDLISYGPGVLHSVKFSSATTALFAGCQMSSKQSKETPLLVKGVMDQAAVKTMTVTGLPTHGCLYSLYSDKNNFYLAGGTAGGAGFSRSWLLESTK